MIPSSEILYTQVFLCDIKNTHNFYNLFKPIITYIQLDISQFRIGTPHVSKYNDFSRGMLRRFTGTKCKSARLDDRYCLLRPTNNGIRELNDQFLFFIRRS